MIELGKHQVLEVVKLASIGVFLNENSESEKDTNILLPKKQVPEDIEVGDTIKVFVYKDSDDRLIATTNSPLITLHQIKLLQVTAVTNIGCFLNWGLEKDLLLPFSQQLGKPIVNDKVLVYLYVDKSERLCATMKVSNQLSVDHEYKIDDIISGTVYSLSPDHGCFVAIDDKYDALIPKHEVFKDYQLGDMVIGRITKVMHNGKCNISPKKKAYMQMDEDSELIIAYLERNKGFAYLTDKSDPYEIKKTLGISKKAFKRALGRLYKEQRIQFIEDGIQLSEEEN